jgi:polyvinyl alcohol dehydrogenase (cytochrome)
MTGTIHGDGSGRPRLSTIVLVAALLATLAGVSRTFAHDDAKEDEKGDHDDRGNVQANKHDWPTIGHDSANTRDQPFEPHISPKNVHRLALKWSASLATAPTTADVSATPAVVNGAVYFGDFNGTLWKLDADTGATIWSHKVPDYTGNAGDYARTSPSLAGNTLVVGIIKGSTSVPGPNMLGIDATTGALRWKSQIHPDSHAAMTGSPILTGDTIITGISANGAGGANATFRGAIVALNAQTGAIIWRTYSLPDNGGVPGGYAGATMFSPPAVDVSKGLVYGTFGQPYTEPASVTACHTSHGGFTESCELPGSYLRSIVAFDLKTGTPKWSYRVIGHGPWLQACGSQPAAVTWCAPEADGEKWDIGGSGANVMRVRMGGHKHENGHKHDDGDNDGDDKEWRDVVGFGGKSGVYTLLDAETGQFIWDSLIGPGGDQGGMEWGTAFDGKRIYASITNHHHIPYELTQNGVISNVTATGGSWAALDPATGKILWQTADPQTETVPGFSSPVGVWDLAPVTVAHGVLYASSMAKSGSSMYALDAATGAILWQYDPGSLCGGSANCGSSVNSGPAVVNGSVYWGSGYSRSGVEGSGNRRLYAFSIDGK